MFLGGFQQPQMGFSTIGDMMSKYFQAGMYNPDGSVNQGASQAGGVFAGAGKGAMLGSIIPGLGTAVGGLVGGIAGFLSGKMKGEKAKIQFDRHERIKKDLEAERDESINRAILSTYPTEGVKGSAPMYAQGGLKPLSSVTQEAVGARHEQGGINMGDHEIEDNEIKMDVPSGSFYFSDRLKTGNVTFAEKAKSYSGQVKKGEDIQDKAGNIYQYNTGNREVMKGEAKLVKLAQEQEMSKQMRNYAMGGIYEQYCRGGLKRYAGGGFDPNFGRTYSTYDDPYYRRDNLPGSNPLQNSMNYFDRWRGVPNIQGAANPDQVAYTDRWSNRVPNIQKGSGLTPLTPPTNSPANTPAYSPGVTNPRAGRPNSMGLNMRSIIENTAPFIDNIVNARLTANAPEIPKPRFTTFIPGDTEYNVRPQLSEVRRSVRASGRMAREMLPSTQGAVAAQVAASAKGLEQTSKIMGQKENIETQLRNQETMRREANINRNIGLASQYDEKRFHRQDDLRKETSANVADFSNDIKLLTQQANQKDLDTATLLLLKEKYKDTGVWTRNHGDLFARWQDGKLTMEQLLDLLKSS